MEFKSLDDLERQVHRLLEQFRAVKQERDDLAARAERREAEVAEVRRANQRLRKEIAKAQRNSPDTEREEQIKARVDELLAKLEGF